MRPLSPIIRLSILLDFGSALASVLITPYLLELNTKTQELPIPIAMLVLIQATQGFVLSFILSLIGLRLSDGLSLRAPLLAALAEGRSFTFPKSLALVFVFGLGLGSVIQALDALIFLPLQPDAIQAASAGATWWKGMLASFYGGWHEEIVTRLFVMTLLVWVLSRALRSRASLVYGLGIVFAALFFALSHLPQITQLAPLSSPVVLRVVILNLMGGIPFGYLYWKKGLEHAMICHFAADLSLHAII